MGHQNIFFKKFYILAGFYESYRDDEKRLCSPCHKSCQLHCTSPGAKGCVACRGGYAMDSEHGCADVDECAVRNDTKIKKMWDMRVGCYFFSKRKYWLFVLVPR